MCHVLVSRWGVCFSESFDIKARWVHDGHTAREFVCSLASLMRLGKPCLSVLVLVHLFLPSCGLACVV